MGIYYNKLVESATTVDPEDVVQTADEVGNDLEAIEKAVEDREGLDGGCFTDGYDCVEEATMIMFESEYNMSQLLKRIGITELNEYANGRDFVLEGANLKAFCTRVADNLKRMFARFVELFKTGLKAIQDAVNTDKQLLKHENKMKAGSETESWAVKTFDLVPLDVKNNSKVELNIFTDDDLSVEKVLSYNGVNVTDIKMHDDALTHQSCIKRVSGMDAEEASGMLAKLKEVIFVMKDYDRTTPGVFETVVDILKNTDDISVLKEAYANVKRKYDALLKEIKNLEKAYSKEGDKDNAGVVTKALTAVTYEKNLQNQCYSVCLKAYRTRRSIARRLAKDWIEKAPKEEKPKNESTRLFDFDLM